MKQTSKLHNFTIESQIRFHAPLAFEPQILSNGQDIVHGLTQESLKVFVNSAEWTLGTYLRRSFGTSSQVDGVPQRLACPTIPFSISSCSFHPFPTHRYAYSTMPVSLGCFYSGRNLIELGQPISSDSFILPQWGGVVLLNLPADTPSKLHLTDAELDHVFSGFRAQLLRLIGVSELPREVQSIEPDRPLTDFQLDTLYRQRAFENVGSSRETLQSIVKLVDQIPNMPVGRDVRDDVLEALSALELVCLATSIHLLPSKGFTALLRCLECPCVGPPTL